MFRLSRQHRLLKKTYRARSAARVAITTTLAISLNGARARTATTTRRRARAARITLGRRRRGRRSDLAGGLTPRTSGTRNLGSAAGNNGRPGRRVPAHGGMDAHRNARVPLLVRAGELDGGRAEATTATNSNLVAGDVELAAARGGSRVQGQGLGAQKVVARLDVGGDLDVHLAAARVEVARAPVVVVADPAAALLGPAVGEDLEPAARGAVGGRGVGDLGHVYLDGAPVGAADGFAVAGSVAVLLVGGGCGGQHKTIAEGRSKIILTWCISTVTVPPALTGHLPEARPGWAPQANSWPPTLVTGELEPGTRAHEDPCWACQY